MKEPVPVAVVGAGHMGRHHARVFGGLPGARLVAIVDPQLDRARELGEQYGAAAYRDVRDLPPTIAAATVAVPTTLHVAVAEELIGRGVAVLVEKPLAPSVALARRLLESARQRGTLLAVGHTERFNPAVRAIQRFEIEPMFIETERISPFSFRSADIGVVADMMIHDIDILLHLLSRRGRPPAVARVDAVGVTVLGAHEDIANARLAFENGAVANLTASRLALKTHRRLRVFSRQAYISVDYQNKNGIAIVKDANLDILKMAAERKLNDLSQMAGMDFGRLVKVEPLVVDDVDPLRAELEAFLHSVQTGAPPAVSGEDAVAALELAERIVAAVREHHWELDPT